MSHMKRAGRFPTLFERPQVVYGWLVGGPVG